MNTEDQKGQIVPIKDSDIKRIVSGQAIYDLSSVVKELIDNSLDAGSKNITIKLVNSGIDEIEVIDDGHGVPKESRKFLATKHATSKISTFEDIYLDQKSIEAEPSLGFRGEALFCLANLSQKLIITTKTEKEQIGEKLYFRRDGSLDESNVEFVPKKVGTTVKVCKIFDPLPVRRVDFHKRIKAQRSKLLKLMQGYAIISVGVKFSLFDMKKGKSDVMLSTSTTSRSIEDTTSSVLGHKFLKGMSNFHVDLASLQNSLSSSDAKLQNDWRIEGLVSNTPFDDEKNSARDFQFFAINNRPVELPKIARLIGEVWRSLECNASKKPACVLKFILPKSDFDINLSPSKREVLLTKEIKICEFLREALLDKWSRKSIASFHSIPSTSVNINECKVVSPVPFEENTLNMKYFGREKTSLSSRARNITTGRIESRLIQRDNKPKQKTLAETQAWFRIKKEFNEEVVSPQLQDIIKLKTSNHALEQEERVEIPKESASPVTEKIHPSKSNLQQKTQRKRKRESQLSSNKVLKSQIPQCTPTPMAETQATENNVKNEMEENDTNEPSREATAERPKKESDDNGILEYDTWDMFGGTENVIFQSTKAITQAKQVREQLKMVKELKKQINNVIKPESPDTIKTNMTVDSDGEEDINTDKVQLCKEDFLRMDIIGQFNLGFILAICPNKNLWILDQHACDERYHFERISNTTVIHEQKLISPLPLELSPFEESCILDNIDVFHKNGFRFKHSPSNPVRHRFSLTALPLSGSGGDGFKAIQFTKDDVSELCNLLSDESSSSKNGSRSNNAVERYLAGTSNGITISSETTIRLPKAIAMFASRACRSSIMIGTALSKKEMSEILLKVHEVENPWICAHGRPTLKHVKDLYSVLLKDEYREARYAAHPCFSLLSQSDDSGDESISCNDNVMS